MKARVFAIILAVFFHAALILFGGLLFWRVEDSPHYQEVELLAEDTGPLPESKKEKEERPKEKETAERNEEEVTAETETAPDAAEMIASLEASAATSAPALEAASLGAIEAALSGATLAGGGDFGRVLTFASGGRIGGLGKPGAVLDEQLDQVFSLAEIDQKPRPIFQAAPTYPAEMRAQKVIGLVQIILVVDAQGRVAQAKIEKTSHDAFNRPALEAVRRWKFEPAVKGGQKVDCKLRVPIRFVPS